MISEDGLLSIGIKMPQVQKIWDVNIPHTLATGRIKKFMATVK